MFSSIQLLVNEKFIHQSSFKLIKTFYIIPASIYATLFIKVGGKVRGEKSVGKSPRPVGKLRYGKRSCSLCLGSHLGNISHEIIPNDIISIDVSPNLLSPLLLLSPPLRIPWRMMRQAVPPLAARSPHEQSPVH